MKLDVITIGRSSVDLYGAQIGGRLEDMASFEKYVGGSPTNMAVGTARLGLKSALISRVGDEHMGRFIREQLQREGVNTDGLITDDERLTALVLLGIRDKERFPLIFYRENCADMALCEADIDPDFIKSARAIVVTGTHLSNGKTQAAVLKALNIARKNNQLTALDIDFRPNLWGLSGHDDGENRFIANPEISAKLQSTLHLFDVIVGTEEEFHIAGGSTDTIAALRAVRTVTQAILVCKRGPMGAAAFTDKIPDTLDEGESGPGFPIEVFNVLGAGDGFMSGLIKGWLEGENWSKTLTYANACGAIAVSRHGCAPAYPSLKELEFFLERGVVIPALRKDLALEQIHWSSNRTTDWPDMRVFAFDHRVQLEEVIGATPKKIGAFKELCVQVTKKVANGRRGYGLLCDGRLGRDGLYQAVDQGLWIGRPVELPGSRPLKFEAEIGPDCGGLCEWPLSHVVKVLCFYHPDDSDEMRAEQEASILRLFHASRRNRLEFLLEIIASKAGPIEDDTSARFIQRFYDLGVFPDWWKLEPMRTQSAWQNTCDAINRNDPHTRGIVILGLGNTQDALAQSFEIAAQFPLVKGFAVGRTIFANTDEAWMNGEISDAEAIATMATKYAALCDIWDAARAKAAMNKKNTENTES